MATTSLWKRRDYKAEWAKYDADRKEAHEENFARDRNARMAKFIEMESAGFAAARSKREWFKWLSTPSDRPWGI